MKSLGIYLCVLFGVVNLPAQSQEFREARQMFIRGVELADKEGRFEESRQMLEDAREMLDRSKRIEDSLYIFVAFTEYHTLGRLGKWEDALLLARHSFDGYQKFGVLPGDSSSRKRMIDICYDIGYIFEQKGQTDSAFWYYQQAVDQYKDLLKGERNDDVALAYHRTGHLFRAAFRYEEAHSFYEKAFTIWKQLSASFIKDRLMSSYEASANLYADEGKWKKSVFFNEKYLNGLIEKDSISWIPFYNLGRGYKNLGDSLNSFQKYRQAIEELQRDFDQLPISQQQLHSRYMAIVYANMGEYYKELSLFSQAETYFIKSLQSGEQGLSQSAYGRALIELGRIYRMKGEMEKSYTHLEEGLQILRESRITLLIAFASGQMALNLEADGKLEEALQYRHWGLQALTKGDLSFSDEDLRREVEGEEIPLSRNYVAFLLRRSKLLVKIFEKTGDIKDLELAEQGSRIAEDKVSQMQLQLKSDANFPALVKELYECQLQILHARQTHAPDMKWIRQAYVLMEKSKAWQLREHLKDREARHFGGLPDSLLLKERMLRERMAHFQSLVFKEEQKGARGNTEQVQSWKESFFSYQNEFQELLQSYESQYPRYHQLKYETDPFPLEALQAELSADKAILSFFVGDSVIQLMRIRKGGVDWIEQPKPQDFDQQVAIYYESFSRPGQQLKESPALLKELLAWATTDMDNEVDQLLVLPDDVLNYLPFEVLKVGLKGDKEDYLIERFDIQYAFSASVWVENKQRPTSGNRELFAGFAPSYGDESFMPEPIGESSLRQMLRGGNAALPGARREVESIHRLLGGRLFLDQEANKGQFLSQASDFRILHLAMHALVEDGDPMFSGFVFPAEDSTQAEWLYAHELYPMELDADMVVLSACNTGFGKLRKGEGIMSLSRAFAFAGCPSMLMSLWQLPDEQTSIVMEFFYEGLKAGLSKDEALRQAKLSYLAQTETAEYMHPFYWAGLVILGDEQPLFSSIDPIIRNLFIAAALLWVLGFIVSRVQLRRFKD